MEYVNLGRTGLKVSRITLGCMSYGVAPPEEQNKPGRHAWTLDEAQSQAYLKQALDLGINCFDTANVYSSGASEEVVGRFLKANVRRESVVIATKVQGVMRSEPNGSGLSRKAIFNEVDASLRRLETDYIDLYQTHRWDYETPIEETLEALHDLVKAGKVRYIGASSLYAWQFTKALYLADKHGWTRFVSMQNHYNLPNREEARELLSARGRRRRLHLTWG
jgi:aryl-alcohol dehydrogenase-like predicted oxidoreductase